MTYEIAKVTKVQTLEDYWLRVWFADGAIKDVNFANRLRGPVFEPIRNDRTIFESVTVDHELGTIVWPGDVDVDPDVLYGTFEPEVGPPYERREVRPPGAPVS